MVKNLQCRSPGFHLRVRKIPWRRDRLPTPIFLAFPVAQLVKNLPTMWETWVRSLCWEDSLEEGKATHSSILAWRIPWTVHPQWGRKELNTAEQLSIHFTSLLLHINRLNGTGNSTQCSVITYMGKESKQWMYVYVYVTDSLCCTAETNTPVCIT